MAAIPHAMTVKGASSVHRPRKRLWRSLKYECIYLHAFETGSALRAGLTWWIAYYNTRRPHSMLAGRTPDEAYTSTGIEKVAA